MATIKICPNGASLSGFTHLWRLARVSGRPLQRAVHARTQVLHVSELRAVAKGSKPREHQRTYTGSYDELLPFQHNIATATLVRTHLVVVKDHVDEQPVRQHTMCHSVSQSTLRHQVRAEDRVPAVPRTTHRTQPPLDC
jgi:hypothetical protein